MLLPRSIGKARYLLPPRESDSADALDELNEASRDSGPVPEPRATNYSIGDRFQVSNNSSRCSRPSLAPVGSHGTPCPIQPIDSLSTSRQIRVTIRAVQNARELTDPSFCQPLRSRWGRLQLVALLLLRSELSAVRANGEEVRDD